MDKRALELWLDQKDDLLAGRMADGSDYLQITFTQDGEWVKEEASREQIASPIYWNRVSQLC